MMKSILFVLAFVPAVAFGQLKFDQITDKVAQISSEKSSVKSMLIQDGNDAVLVDVMFDSLSRALDEAMDARGLNIKYVINTHYHGDHTDGNIYFREAEVVAHENTYKHIEDSAMYGPSKTFTPEDMPNILFQSQLTLFVNATRIDLMYFGPAHTSGDAIVHLPEENVVSMGDLILDFPNTLPFAANPEGTLSVLEKLAGKINDDTQVVTGHGSIGRKKDVEALIEIMRQTFEHVRSGKDATDYPEEWNEWDSEFLSMEGWITRLTKVLDKKGH